VRVWRDWVLVGALVPAVLIEGVLRPGRPRRWLQVAAALFLVPTLLWRRAHPLAPVVVSTAVSTAMMLIIGRDTDLVTAVFGVVIVYALFRWGSGRNIVVGAGLLAAVLGLTWALGNASGADTVGGASVVAMLGATGLAIRFRVTARQRALAQARAQERERIARDMHDVVGHHVSGIAVRAQAGLAQAAARRGRTAGGDGSDGSDPLEVALRVIEAETKETLVEMRSLVRTLHEDERGTGEPDGPGGAPRVRTSALPAGPGARAGASGPQAVDVVRLAAGPPFPVVVTVLGEVAGVQADVGAATYRIAQESVTNARRHAHGATLIRVGLTIEAGTLRLRVSDDGEPPGSPFAPGHGIAGMRVRARELGGDVTAGQDREGGWTVEAVLPLTGGRS
jgi:signal transduction histidine kinase